MNDDTKQIKFDGGTVDDRILHARKHVTHLFGGLSKADAVALIPDDYDGEELRYLRYLYEEFENEAAPVVDLPNYEHEYDILQDAGATAWFADECDMDLREAMDFAPLGYYLEELPPKVADVTLNPREWVDRLEQATTFTEASGDTLWWVVVDEDNDDVGRVYTYDGFAYVDKWGGVYDDDLYYFVGDEPYVWTGDPDDKPDIVYTESFHEYANNIVVVTPEGEKLTFEHQDGVAFVWDEHRDAFDWFESVAEPIIAGTYHVSTDAWRGYDTGPQETAEMVRVKEGWHSSMERTTYSDRINEITSGEAHAEHGWDFPVVVQFTKTSNIFSIGIDIYAPKDRIEEVRAHFDGASTGLKGNIGN